MRCRVCSSPHVAPVHPGAPGGPWYGCVGCGSHFSTAPYDPGLYGPGFVAESVRLTGGEEIRRREVRSNCEWFRDHGAGPDFLDVGSCDGAAMWVMAELGHRVHGFDVSEDARRPGCTTIHPYFSAALFPQQYHAVLCREVFEHVVGPRAFLAELVAVTIPGGLLQIQTPRPSADAHPHAYQPGHLALWSPAALGEAFAPHGLQVLDKRFWDGDANGPGGQAWMLRKTSEL